MSKDTRTAWGKEFDAKREAWSENDKLKLKIAELEKDNSDLQDAFDCCYAELQQTRDAYNELEKDLGMRQLNHISTIHQSEGCWVIFLVGNAATCGNRFVSGFHGAGEYGQDDFRLFDDDGEILIGVTHWMPIPTPG